MSQRSVYFNGQYVPDTEARVSIFDSALMVGDMAFEMTRTYNQQLFKLREHLERLYASLRLLEIDCGLTIEEMEQKTVECLERNLPTESKEMDWQIMHNVSRGPLSLYTSLFPQGLEPTVTISCWPLITHMGRFAPKYKSGVDIVIPAQQAIPAHLLDAKAKTRSRLHYQMASMQATRMNPPGAWPVLLDPDGFLTEGPGWNILLVKEGEILSPESRNILLGVSRATLFDIAREEGIPIRETNLGRYEALTADEIFCTATSFGAVHAASFEGQPIGNGQPGSVLTRIREAWKKQVGVDFITQAEQYAEQLSGWESAALASAMTPSSAH